MSNWIAGGICGWIAHFTCREMTGCTAAFTVTARNRWKFLMIMVVWMICMVLMDRRSGFPIWSGLSRVMSHRTVTFFLWDTTVTITITNWSRLGVIRTAMNLSLGGTACLLRRLVCFGWWEMAHLVLTCTMTTCIRWTWITVVSANTFITTIWRTRTISIIYKIIRRRFLFSNVWRCWGVWWGRGWWGRW